MSNVSRSIPSWIVRDIKVAAQERGSEFGHQLFHRVSMVAELIGNLAIQAMFGARPVSQLMQQCSVEVLRVRKRLRSGIKMSSRAGR